MEGTISSGNRGFSLIEMLCTIAIIAILASLLLPAVARAYQRAQRFAVGGQRKPAPIAYPKGWLTQMEPSE